MTTRVEVGRATGLVIMPHYHKDSPLCRNEMIIDWNLSRTIKSIPDTNMWEFLLLLLQKKKKKKKHARGPVNTIISLVRAHSLQDEMSLRWDGPSILHTYEQNIGCHMQLERLRPYQELTKIKHFPYKKKSNLVFLHLWGPLFFGRIVLRLWLAFAEKKNEYSILMSGLLFFFTDKNNF